LFFCLDTKERKNQDFKKICLKFTSFRYNKITPPQSGVKQILLFNSSFREFSSSQNIPPLAEGTGAIFLCHIPKSLKCSSKELR
jgi:hypothetical protein